jgi:hypothetical protein
MKSPISANLRVDDAIRPTISVRLWLLILLAMSGSAFSAPVSNGDDGGCTCADRRLRSGYLTRSVIEGLNALAILKKIDAGDVAGAKLLATEIMKGSKAEMTLLLNQEATKEEKQNAQRVIDKVDAYLDARKQ